MGLTDLTAAVLRHYLPKDPSIRISTEWDNKELSDEQKAYAALDVFASWRIFQSLTTTPIGTVVEAATPGGTPISLLSNDQSLVIAHGHIVPDRPKKHLGINVSKTRVLVTVTSIIIPGHIISGDLLPSHQDTPLSAFPDPPFTLLCKASHVRVRIPSHDNFPSKPAPLNLNISDNLSATMTSSALIAEQDQAHDGSEPWFADVDHFEDGESQQQVKDSVPDPATLAKAKAMLEKVPKEGPILRSRVLGDIIHLMRQFQIPEHGLHGAFAKALWEAFFDFDTEDHAAVSVFLAEKGITFDAMFCQHPNWILQRVKRLVPPPETLFERISTVIVTYGPLKDAKSNAKPMFDDTAWDTATKVLENIRRGFYSDPPNISLYFSHGIDKYSLMWYRYCRGTNSIEGGVHQNIIPDFAVELLRDYVLYHNLTGSMLYFVDLPE